MFKPFGEVGTTTFISNLKMKVIAENQCEKNTHENTAPANESRSSYFRELGESAYTRGIWKVLSMTS